MGHKSKFTFPMPGRFAKQSPTVATSNPPSKAEKILGTGRANIGSPSRHRDHGRSWETGSNGGISISISESSASQSGALDGDEDEDRFAGTTYGRALWEEESEALPRRLRSAHGPGSKSVKPKRSAVTLGARSRDVATDDSNSRRPQSSSTVHSHYESSKMPLSISQQTSNSAMAKGLPSKAGALLDIDGSLFGNVHQQQQKKKPHRLDFSKLRLRSRKDHHVDSHGVGPVLGNNYVMKSPSVISHVSHSMASPTSPRRDEETPRPDMKFQYQPPPSVSARPGRIKGTNDASTLHQLYDHYEQMSFRNDAELREEDEDEEDIGDKGHLNQQHLLPRTYDPADSDLSHEDMITPLPDSTHRAASAGWNHSRNTSQASKITATRAGTPSTLQLRPTSRSDYPASVSSRHTRTSKATPSIMSTLDSDRQQQSVLSLTDSDSDEDGTPYSRPGSSLPSYDNSSRDDVSVSSSQRQPITSRLSISSHTTSPKGASYTQLNDFLTIPHASPKSKNNRSPSTNTMQSTNSSLSTATRVSAPSRQSHQSQQDPRGSVSTTGSVLSPTYSNHTNYSVQEAKAISFTPLASTVEAASSVSADPIPHSLNHTISQAARQRISQSSHTSDQPTPPISPTSAEFYQKAPEPARRDSTASKASESRNARMMAVTRQEEMLLAALRKKRARMRENIIAEIEQVRGARGSGATEEDIEKLASAKLKDAERQAAKEVREARAKAKEPKNFPKRSSSVVGRSSQRSSRSSTGLGRVRDRSNGPRDTNVAPSTSHSDPTEKTVNRLRISPEPEPEPRRAGKARKERVLLFLDRPIDSIDPIDQAEPSPDLSEFMDEELDFPISERQSRTRSKLGSPPYNSPEPVGRPRPDSSPVSPRSSPIKTTTTVMMHAVPDINEDIDADDVDFDDFEEVMPPRRRAPPPTLQPVPERGVPRPDSPVSPADGFLAPSALGHKKGKKSAVRLSAVGQISSPVPWWGDDD